METKGGEEERGKDGAYTKRKHDKKWREPHENNIPCS
jgi:hypothetical protein